MYKWHTCYKKHCAYRLLLHYANGMLVIKPSGFLKQLQRGCMGKGKENFPLISLQVILQTHLREFALEWVACIWYLQHLRHSEQCLFTSPQSAIYFINLSQLVVEILKVFVKHAQNLNTHVEKFGELGLTAGI
jgi:hypothetical protein